MDKNLKPCPFCGSQARIEKSHVRFTKGRRKYNRSKIYYNIGCSDPDCILCNRNNFGRLFFVASSDGLDTMVRRWNRRATEKEQENG